MYVKAWVKLASYVGPENLVDIIHDTNGSLSISWITVSRGCVAYYAILSGTDDTPADSIPDLVLVSLQNRCNNNLAVDFSTSDDVVVKLLKLQGRYSRM